MIKQVQFSDSVKFFKKGFQDKWNLNDYSRINEPAVFVGVYNSLDIAKIKNHKAKKIVFFLGADIPNIPRLIGLPNTVFASDKQNILSIYKSYKMPYIDEIIPLRSFKGFDPCPKGEKIYCYINNNATGNYSKHRLDILQSAVSYFGKDKFIFGTHGHSTDYIIEHWYKQSFINIQLNEMAGFTSALEMAHMGRKSVSNNAAPFCINWETESDIINIISREYQNREMDLTVYNYLAKTNEWLK
jgi:hypothetical protein